MKKPSLVIYLILTSLFYSTILFAQSYQIISSRTIGGSNDENLLKVIRIADKGLLLLGTTKSCDGIISNYKGKDDVFITLVNYQGNIKWTKMWGGALSEKPIDAFYNANAGFINLLMETESKDGDASFKTNNNKVNALMRIKPNGEVLNNAIVDFGSRVNQKIIAKRMVNDNDNSPFFLRDVYLEDNSQVFSRTEIASTDIANKDGGTYPILADVFSIFPDPNDPFGFFQTNDFLKIENGLNQIDGFFLFGTTSNPKIKTPPYLLKTGKNPPLSETLSGFHKSPLNSDDACIIRILGESGYGMKYDGSKCLGGNGNEKAIAVFNIDYKNYRVIISSDSKDGDFKINHGKNDIWIVDISNDLKVKSKINIGTSLNDEFISEATYAEDHSAILTFSNNLKVSQTNSNSYLNAPSDSSGLKLTLINKDGIQQSLSFRLSDKQAKVFNTYENNLLLVAIDSLNNSLVVISVEKGTGKVLWEKNFNDYEYHTIINMHEIVDGVYCLLGNAVPQLGNGSSNQKDIFFTIISNSPDKYKPSNKFNDNLLDRADSDSIKSQTALNIARLQALTVFNNDTSAIETLWKFALISEYLADYELAYKAYATIISKINKERDKTSYSKAIAHQITCKFLMQSEKIEKKVPPPDISESGDGFYGIGINYHVLNNHLLVASITPEKGADKAGLRACDEIVKINEMGIHSDCLTNDKVAEKLRGDKGSSVNLSVKRFGENKLLSFVVSRSFIPKLTKTTQQESLVPVSQPVTSTNATLNQKQQQKQNFLKKVVTALQNDTSLMKGIETAKKINYALTIINKWSNEPVDKNFLLQIDEQLGMVSSLINLAKGKNININTDVTGKISFSDPSLKQIVNYDYAKEAQSKFDSIAKVQPYNEVKIDKNITFVEKGSAGSHSGIYKCIDSYFSNLPANAPKTSCLEPESWVSITSELGCVSKHKESLIKIIFNDDNYEFEMTREFISNPCKTGTDAVTFYNGGGYTKTTTKGEGTFNSNISSITAIYTHTTYMKMQASRNVFHFLGSHEDKTTPGFEKTVTDEPKTVNQQVEFLSENRIKFTSEHGWAIYQKVKDL